MYSWRRIPSSSEVKGTCCTHVRRVLYRRGSCTRADTIFLCNWILITAPNQSYYHPVQHFFHVIALVAYASVPGNSASVEATQKANKTKCNIQHPTKAAPQTPPFSFCRVRQDVVSTPVDKSASTLSANILLCRRPTIFATRLGRHHSSLRYHFPGLRPYAT